MIQLAQYVQNFRDNVLVVSWGIKRNTQEPVTPGSKWDRNQCNLVKFGDLKPDLAKVGLELFVHGKRLIGAVKGSGLWIMVIKIGLY